MTDPPLLLHNSSAGEEKGENACPPPRLQSVLDGRFADVLRFREKPLQDALPSGVSELDFPRGAVTEIHGPPSSGRTTLLHSALAQATAREEVCALIDVDDAFDPASAAAAGVVLSRVLWIRCGGHAERALKVTDLIVQGGGFGMVAMDLGNTPPETARRIPPASWFRFRHAVREYALRAAGASSRGRSRDPAPRFRLKRGATPSSGRARPDVRVCCVESRRASRVISHREGSMFACIHGEGAAASGCAYEFSPLVEERNATTVVVDASGLDRLFGSPAELAVALSRRFTGQGFSGSIAIASNPDAAVHAARGFPGVTVIPAGEEAARLAGLAVELLDPAPQIQETLDCWGIRTFGDLARLPEIGIAERLGSEGVRLQKMARGEWRRPLRPVEPELLFEESAELDYPVAELEPLSFILSRMLHDLCGRLEARALAAIEIRIALKLENGPEHARAIRLPVPMRDVKTLLKLLQLELGAHPLDAPIVAVALQAEAAKPRASQGGLYTPPSPEPEKLELTLARIAGVVGKENVGVPELEDTHRPGGGPGLRSLVIPGAFADNLRLGKPGCPQVRGPPHFALRIYRPPLS